MKSRWLYWELQFTFTFFCALPSIFSQGVVVSQPVDVFLDRSLNSGQGRDSKKLNLFEAAYDVITKDGLQVVPFLGFAS